MFSVGVIPLSLLEKYHKISNISAQAHKIPKLKWFSFGFAVVFVKSTNAICQVEGEDVVGAAPAGDAPTTSEWSTSLVPAKVLLISCCHRTAAVRFCGLQFINVIIENRNVLRAAVVLVRNVMATARRSYNSWDQKL